MKRNEIIGSYHNQYIYHSTQGSYNQDVGFDLRRCKSEILSEHRPRSIFPQICLTVGSNDSSLQCVDQINPVQRWWSLNSWQGWGDASINMLHPLIYQYCTWTNTHSGGSIWISTEAVCSLSVLVSLSVFCIVCLVSIVSISDEPRRTAAHLSRGQELTRLVSSGERQPKAGNYRCWKMWRDGSYRAY